MSQRGGRETVRRKDGRKLGRKVLRIMVEGGIGLKGTWKMGWKREVRKSAPKC